MKSKKEGSGSRSAPRAAPKKYRMLKKGEPTEPTDEMQPNGTEPWEAIGDMGLTVIAPTFKVCRPLFDPEIMYPIRREVQSAKRSAKELPRSRLKSKPSPRNTRSTPKRPQGGK